MKVRKKLLVDFVDFHWNSSGASLYAMKQKGVVGAESIDPYHLLTPGRFKKYDLVLSPTPAVVFFSDFGKTHYQYSVPKIYCTGEPKLPNFKLCDFAFSLTTHPPAVAAKRNFRLPDWQLYFGFKALLKQRGNLKRRLAAKKKFCCFVYRNPHCAPRNAFFKALSRYRKVDAPGALFNNMKGVFPEKKDWAEELIDFMRPYKFVISFENCSKPGYTSEKLSLALAADTVPIYWGNPEIKKEFNPAAFINTHAFPNFEAVVEQVRSVDRDESLYARYLAAPFFPDGKLPAQLQERQILANFETVFDQLERITPVATTASGKNAMRRYRLQEFLTIVLRIVFPSWLRRIILRFYSRLK